MKKKPACVRTAIAQIKYENIRLIFLTGEDKKKNQYEEVLSLIAQKVDVLAFSPSKRDGWDEVLLEAENAGIPVIITDRSVLVEDESLWLTCIGSDFIEEGKKAARWLVEYMKDPGKEIYIVGGTDIITFHILADFKPDRGSIL